MLCRRDEIKILMGFVGPDNNGKTEFGIPMAIVTLFVENKDSEAKRVCLDGHRATGKTKAPFIL